MGDDLSNPKSLTKFSNTTTTTTTTTTTNSTEEGQKRDQAEEGDGEVWETFDRNFRQVQSVLDRNRILIQQVNENHQSRIADNMVKNVALIQEINGNISRVAALYSDLSTNFSSFFHQRTKDGNKGEKPYGCS